jgi:putative peptide zinc metalloprotease protein
MLVVAFQLPVIGVLMTIGMGVTFVVVPIFKLFKYLTIEPELHRKRGRAIGFTSVVAATVIITFGLIKFPYNIYAQGVVQAAQHEKVRSIEGGFIDRVLVKDGMWVHKGDSLLILHNDQLTKDIAAMEADRDAQRIMANPAMADDPAQHNIEQMRLQNFTDKLTALYKRRDDLTIKAPFDGVFINPDIAQLGDSSAFVAPSQTIGLMMTMQDIEVRAVVEQDDMDWLEKDYQHENYVIPAEIRLNSDPSKVLSSRNVMLIGSAQDDLVSAVLGTSAGGTIAVDPRDPKGTKAVVPQFEVRIRLNNPSSRYYPGQGATVRFTLAEKYPLIAQWSLEFWQLIQTKSATSQW